MMLHQLQYSAAVYTSRTIVPHGRTEKAYFSQAMTVTRCFVLMVKDRPWNLGRNVVQK